MHNCLILWVSLCVYIHQPDLVHIEYSYNQDHLYISILCNFYSNQRSDISELCNWNGFYNHSLPHAKDFFPHVIPTIIMLNGDFINVLNTLQIIIDEINKSIRHNKQIDYVILWSSSTLSTLEEHHYSVYEQLSCQNHKQFDCLYLTSNQ